MRDAEDKVRRAARADYLAGQESLRVIAERHGISIQKLTYWRRKGAWPARPAPKSVQEAGPPNTRMAGQRARPADDREAVVARLWRTIDAALTRLEAAMKKGRRPTSVEAEREARALGALIRNLGQIAELESDAGRSRRDGIETTKVDPDRLRSDLAERLGRLQRGDKRRDQGSPDGS